MAVIVLGVLCGSFFVPWAVPIALRRVFSRRGCAQDLAGYEVVINQKQWVFCMVGGGGVGCLAAVAQPFGLLTVAVFVCGVSMLVGVMCDILSRVLPRECSKALALSGIVVQYMVAGAEGLLAGFVVGVVVLMLCFLVNYVGSSSGKTPVGWGDVWCMFALSLATGSAALVGIGACFLSAAAVSLILIVGRDLSLRDFIPFAPYLAVWLVVGLVICL